MVTMANRYKRKVIIVEIAVAINHTHSVITGKKAAADSTHCLLTEDAFRKPPNATKFNGL